MCGNLIETDNPEDADWVVHFHVVCGRPCYEEGHKRLPPYWMEQLALPLRLDPG